ncbi:hypothetical protein M9Y10_005867 [Tritrichomonas musculus]|uniref:Uncharacterized protein n=1 Tax=Tritrichomonas musculus TaxID=1915356 RepID=A0ABR2JEX6_9EUKA
MELTKNAKINRQKLNRFLDSLKVRTSEELNERKRIGEKYISVENNFLTIKDTATQVVFSSNPSRVYRESHLSVKPQTKYIDPQEDEQPKYIPASKYPLPMSPMQYKPAQKCKNASRLLNLSKLRSQRSRSVSHVDTKKDVSKVPFTGFSVEKIDTNVY